jgi:hypothetical protein
MDIDMVAVASDAEWEKEWAGVAAAEVWLAGQEATAWGGDEVAAEVPPEVRGSCRWPDLRR